MNVSVLTTLGRNLTATATDAVVPYEAVLGVGLALLALFLSVLGAYGICTLTLLALGAAPRSAPAAADNTDDADSPEGKNKKEKTDKQEDTSPLAPALRLLSQPVASVYLGNVFWALGQTVVLFATSALSALREGFGNLSPLRAVIAGLSFVLALAFLWTHDIILPAVFEATQCYVRPVLDRVIFPLLNTARVLYASFWPFVNAGRDIIGALTTGALLILVECVRATGLPILDQVVAYLATGLRQFAESLSTFAINFLSYDRWELLPALVSFGQAFNATRALGDCYCLEGGVFFDLIYALPTQPALYLTVDCGVNVVASAVQFLLVPVLTLTPPNSTRLAEEYACYTFSLGDYAQDVLLLVIEFFTGVIELIESKLAALFAARDVAFTRVAALYAVAEVRVRVPPALRAHLRTRGAAPYRTVALAAFAAADESISAQHGRRAGLFAEVDPVIGEQLGASYGASWNFFTRPNITSLTELAFDALFRLGNAPWARLFTAPVNVIAGTVNLTINALAHPVSAFASGPAGIAYFQIGLLGDYSRMIANAAAELLAFFSAALPCTFLKPLQVVFSVPETVAELIIGTFFTVYQPWQMGVPAPVNCSAVNCSFSFLSWNPLKALPPYYAWNGSRLRRSLTLLLEGGECTAYLLGCNTSADNNNSTNAVSNCTDAPLACVTRAVNRVLVSSLNATLAFLFYAPNLLTFSANETTFAALPIAETRLAWQDFIVCFGLLVDSFDSTMCMTPEPPAPRPTNPNGTLPPDVPIGVFGTPPRTEWECRLNGGAYYWDGREVIVLNTSDVFAFYASQLLCNLSASRACAIAFSESVEVLGSGPESNVTLVISPAWVDDASAQPLVLVYNTTTGASLEPLPNASTLAAVYNVSSVVQTDCTAPSPPPATLSAEYACRIASNLTTYISPYRQASFFYAALTASTFNLLPADLACTTNVDPRLRCPSSGQLYIDVPRIGTRQVFQQIRLPNTSAVDGFISCVANAYPVQFLPVTRVTCLANALVVLREPPPFTVPPGEDLYWPVYYYPDVSVSASTVPVPCENVYPAAYQCLPFNASLAAMHVGGTTPSDVLKGYTSTPGEDYPLFCRPNPATVAPLCTRVTVEYLNGLTAVVELEGGEVRVYVNGTKEAVPCLYQDLPFNGSAVASASAAVPAREEGVQIRELLAAAHATLDAQYAARDARVTAPIVRAGDLRQLRVDPGALLARGWRASAATTQARLQQARQMLAVVEGANATTDVFRKQTLLCCLSDVLVLTGEFLTETFYTVLDLVLGLLTRVAVSSTQVDVPTFAKSRDLLREALCRFACFLSDLIPFTIPCVGVAAGSCGTVDTCAKTFLCELFELPVLIVDFVVTVLTLLRDVQQGATVGVSLFGENCNIGNTAGCLTSFIVAQVLAPIKATTRLLRGAAGLLDCLFCALVQLVTPSTSCLSIFYAVVDALADIVDAAISTLLTLFINFVIAVVQFAVYFFTGRWVQAGNVLLTYFVGFLTELFVNLGTIILQALERLPIIGPIVRNILSVFRTSCNVFNKIITTFGARALDCTSVPSRKRGEQQLGWLAGGDLLSALVTRVWDAELPRAVCRDRMAALNATDGRAVADDPVLVQEVNFCLLAHTWVGPNATAPPDAAPTVCDGLMPALYRAGEPWAAIGEVHRAHAAACLHQRLLAEEVRRASDSASWVPHDLYYGNQATSLLRFGGDLLFSFGVWRQFAGEQVARASQLVAPAYRTALVASGLSADHLDRLAAGDPSTAAVYAAVKSGAGDFSLNAYAERAVALVAADPVLPTPPVARVVGLVASVWQPLLNASVVATVGGAGSIVGDLLAETMARLDARNDYTTTSLPLTAATWARLLTADDPEVLLRATKGLFDSLLYDVPAVLARVAGALAPASAADLASGRKRAAALDPVALAQVPRYLYDTVRGSFALAGLMWAGTTSRLGKWAEDPTTRAWLATEGAHGRLAPETRADGAGTARAPTLVSDALAALFSGVGRVVLPLSRNGAAIGALFQEALAESTGEGGGAATTTTLRVSLARTRRASMSHFTTRVGLALYRLTPSAAFVAQHEARRTRVHAAETNNVTGATCLFAFNSSNSSNVTNITYPLCQTCPILDEVAGRVQRAYYNVLLVNGVSVPSCAPNCTLNAYPSLNYSGAQAVQFEAYITTPSAVAVLGDSPTLPVRWPWRDYDNWRLLGDPTPNKTGFADLRALVAATRRFLSGTVRLLGSASAAPASRLTAPPLAGVVNVTRVRPRPTLFERLGERLQAGVVISDSGISAPFEVALRDGARQLGAYLADERNFAAAVETASVPPVIETWRELVLAWVDFLLGFVLCPFNALSLNAKRFSLGETLVVGGLALFVFFAALQFWFSDQPLVVLSVAALLTAAALFVGWVTITYEYGVFCAPALPTGLADDAIYLLAFTLLPKCSALYGIVDESYYDGGTCYACANWQAGIFTVPNFFTSFANGGRFGFSDLRYNVAFILRAGFPDVYAALRPGGYLYTAPVLGALVSSAFVQTPLAAYAGFERATATDVAFAQFWQGATWVTGVANLVVVASAAYLFLAVFFPFIVQSVAFVLGILLLLPPLLLFVFGGVGALTGVVLPGNEPYAKPPATAADVRRILEGPRRQPRRGRAKSADASTDSIFIRV